RWRSLIKVMANNLKILTNVRFAQTAGIAQVVLGFLDFIEQGKAKHVSLVAVNIMQRKKPVYRRKQGKRTVTITIGLDVPNIGEVTKQAKTLTAVEQTYELVIRAYQRAIQADKPDVVLINGTYFMTLCLLLAAEREGVRAVVHYHGVLSKEVQFWAKPQRKLLLDMERCFDRPDLRYIFPSRITKRVVEQEVFLHAIKKSAIIANPVAPHFFEQLGEKPPSRAKKHIGIVSRWTGIKNVQFAEQLAAYNRRKGSKFVINIITDLKKTDKRYQKLARLMTFHTARDSKRMAHFYRRMDVMISPSHFETYGNVSKEAVAAGTPALVNPNMGISETFKKLGLSRWVAPFHSVESVYQKIERTIGQPVEQSVQEEMRLRYCPEKIFGNIIAELVA
ncbi:MAG: glycosyltransferase family 4 protein, partial [Candidatus Saccharimonadales bacterium]